MSYANTRTSLPTRRLSAIAVVFTLLFALLAPVQASASVAEETSFIAKVNNARASVGLPALVPDVQLTNLARGWAGSMRDGACGEGNFICHASPISAGVTHSWAKLGENVGTGPDVTSVMNAFIASPGHYANIVDPEFTHIGVGVVWDGNRMYTTHRFMKLQGAPTTTTTTTAAPTTTTTAAPTTTTTQASSPTTVTLTTEAPSTTTTTSIPSVVTTAPDERLDPNSDEAQDAAREDGLGIESIPLPQPSEVLEERAGVLLEAFSSIS